jgi:hypothetical protein
MADELSVASDKLPVRFRAMARELAARGWEIDAHALTLPHDGPARVVPSPARRLQAGWVFDPLPLRGRAAGR